MNASHIIYDCNKICNVIFEENGGSLVLDVSDKKGYYLISPQTTKTGYRFVGWYKDNGSIEKWDFNNRVLEDMTLYAKWELES